MKRLLVATQYFYPENFRINDMCLEWVKRGYDVTVLTGIPNYPVGDIYEGYKREYKEEEWNGIHIIRLPVHERGHSLLTLFLNCFTYVYYGKKWVKKVVKENNGNFPYDTFFTYEVSPMTQALVGVYATKKYGVKSILYVQDLWPENVIEIMGITTPIVIKPIENMVKKIYRDTNMIFATSESFVKVIQDKIENKADIDKVKYWPQYAEDFYKSLKKNKLNDKFRICFTGNIGKTQGLDILAKTAKLIRNDYNLQSKKIDIEFVIVGDGRQKEEFIKSIKENDVEDMFVLMGKKSAHEIPEILSTCDVAFLSFANIDLFKMTIPAKLQSYMACGMPILASADGETKNIIETAKCGICSKIGNAASLVDGIYYLINNIGTLTIMGNNARNYYEVNFQKQKLMDYIEEYM